MSVLTSLYRVVFSNLSLVWLAIALSAAAVFLVPQELRATSSMSAVTALQTEEPINITPTSLTISEPAGSASFAMTLTSAPSSAVDIALSSSEECSLSTTLVTLNNGNWSSGETVWVTAVDDDVDDGPQTCLVETAAAISNDEDYHGFNPADVEVTVNDDDTAGFLVSPTSLTISEPSGSADFSIRLTSEPTAAVNVALSPGSDECSVSPLAVALSDSTWNDGVTITVRAVDDDVVDGPQPCTVITGPVTSDDSNYAVLAVPDVSVTVQDDDTATVRFSNSTYSVNEGAGVATISVDLSEVSGHTVSVDYASSGGTAIADSDYTATSGTLTFAPGETSKTFSVPITDDALNEPDETVNLALSNPVGATLGSPNSAVLTIVDNEGPVTVQFEPATFSVDEAASVATINVTLSTASAVEVRVGYASSDGTATAGSDYTATSGTLLFTPGDTSETFTVPITNDTLDEPAETVNLALSSPVGAALGSPSSAVLTIVDNDDPPQVRFRSSSYSVIEGAGSREITVELSAPSGHLVTVAIETSDGTATAGSDYTPTSDILTFAPGVTVQTFLVPIIDDNVDEPSEYLSVTLGSPNNATLGAPNPATLFIVDNDDPPTVKFSNSTYSVNEGDGAALITVLLSEASGFTVSVDYATVGGGTATPGSDYTSRDNTLVFVPGQTERTFTIPISDDAIDEPMETVNLALSNPVGTTLGSPSSAVMSIVDNDGLVTVQFEPTTFTVTEASGMATISVTLSAPSGLQVQVDYATSDGTATADSDYTGTSGTFTFAPGETQKSFGVPIHADQLVEPDETVNLELNKPVGAVLGAPNDKAVLTIKDSTEPPRFELILPIVYRNYVVGEPNDTCATAYGIVHSNLYNFLPDDQHDWYQFDLSGSGNLIVGVTNFVPMEGQIAVFKGDSCASANLVGQDGMPASTKILNLGVQSTGHYYIYVSNDGVLNKTTAYQLYVRFP